MNMNRSMISALVTKYREILYRRQHGPRNRAGGGGRVGLVISFKKIEFLEVAEQSLREGREGMMLKKKKKKKKERLL